jgi:uncharacterized membrane protein
MKSRASVHSHPIHPMLVGFPIALWFSSFVADMVFHFGWGGLFWKDMAFYTMAGGVIGALIAAVPGFIDYQALTVPRLRRIAATHMALNLVTVVLFVFNLGVRLDASRQHGLFEVVLTAVGLVILGMSGWLGATLVHIYGVSVDLHPPQHPQDRGQDRAA